MAKEKKKPHYVDNEKFTQAVHDYVTSIKVAETSGEEIPKVSNYIGECFWKIAQGLTNTRKFIRRTYKDDLIMDAVEDCLRRIHNYKIDAPTRSGKPNAFAYFTQICYYSFLRTVDKHNKEIKKRLRVMENTAIATALDSKAADSNEVLKYLDEIRKPWEEEVFTFPKKQKKPKNLEKFMGDSFQSVNADSKTEIAKTKGNDKE